MAKEKETLTPMMRQYMEIKKEHQDKVLFFRLGDFYEMFAEDAEEVSKLLNLTLTHRGANPMCGIPYHALKNYLKRLLDYGKKVALCEQFVDPSNPRELAKREVTQVFTPATVVDGEFLDSLASNYVLAINVDRKGIYLAWTDISTGEFYIRNLSLDKSFAALENVLTSISAKEIIVSDNNYFSLRELKTVLDGTNANITKLPSWYFSIKDGKKETIRQFSENALRLFSIDEKDMILTSIGALLSYLSETAKSELPQLRVIERVEEESYMALNSAAIRNLEILSSMTNENRSEGTLFQSINKTKTASGARFLKHQLVHPLVDINKINERHDWVEKLIKDKAELDRIRRFLSETSDLERLSVKASMRKLNARDILAIAESVNSFFAIVSEKPEYLSLTDDFSYSFEALIDYSNEAINAINRECTNIQNEGTIILDGYDSVLDELRGYLNNGSERLNEYVEKLKADTEITVMKSGENRIIGAYIEVSKGQLDKVPDYFIRRQTLVGGERFTTPELEAIKDKINAASIEASKRELEVFKVFLDKAESLYPEISKMGMLITYLDFYSSLAFLANEKNYVKPVMLKDGDMEIINGRHPVVEDYTGRNSYIANSFSTKKSRFSLITGPNMAGKSTYLREIAIITLLAHVGSFVPAEKAYIPIVDKIFCRVGASDNLSKGESTFLVEMSESSQILRSATRNSLVIMDEIGRGTSTQDGMSLAYAIMNYLTKLGSITLFATHYHELTLLDTSSLQLLHMAVKEEKNSITFLRKAVEGSAGSSYGIHVARLAGLPREVISEANSFQKKHFADYSAFDSQQGDLFLQSGEEEESLLGELSGLIKDFDLDSSTPLEAMMFISELKKIVK